MKTSTSAQPPVTAATARAQAALDHLAAVRSRYSPQLGGRTGTPPTQPSIADRPPARTPSHSVQPVSGPDRMNGSAVPRANAFGAVETTTKQSSRWPFWNIITKAEIARRREARRLNPPPPAKPRDPQIVAAEKAAKRARLFLPNGKRAEQHWRPWLEAAAKAERMTLDEAAEHFGGIEALSAPKGYRHRMALCEFANAMAAQAAA